MVQSLISFFSNLQVLQIKDYSSPYSSLRPVTLYISLPWFQTTTLPLHVGHSRWASNGLVNHTRLLNLKLLSVSAPTGHTSIMLPENSLSIEFSIYVLISVTSPRHIMPCTRLGVS